jgi:hypothetical protein
VAQVKEARVHQLIDNKWWAVRSGYVCSGDEAVGQGLHHQQCEDRSGVPCRSRGTHCPLYPSLSLSNQWSWFGPGSKEIFLGNIQIKPLWNSSMST